MMAMIILSVNVIVLAGLGWWIYKRQPQPLKGFYWPALGLKLFAGLAVGWVYFYHYGQGDTLNYLLDGRIVAEKIISNPDEAWRFYWTDTGEQRIFEVINDKPRSLFFVKIAGIVSLLSGGNYWMMASLLSFVSFLGSWYLFRKVLRYFPDAGFAAALSFLFYPSVVFWSSGLIKESLGLAAVFLMAGFFLTLLMNERPRWWEWFVFLLAVWIGWNLKYYWVGIFVPVALTTFFVSLLKRSWRNVARFDWAAWVFVFVVLLLVATSIHPNFYPNRVFEVIVENNLEFMHATDPGNAIHFYSLTPTLKSILTNAPQAILAALFRPFPWEATNALAMVASVENLVLLALVLSAIPLLRSFPTGRHRLLAIAILAYVLILATFLALSTPNLGTLSRYKIGFLPFFIFLVVYKNQFVKRVVRSKSNVARSGD